MTHRYASILLFCAGLAAALAFSPPLAASVYNVTISAASSEGRPVELALPLRMGETKHLWVVEGTLRFTLQTPLKVNRDFGSVSAMRKALRESYCAPEKFTWRPQLAQRAADGGAILLPGRLLVGPEDASPQPKRVIGFSVHYDRHHNGGSGPVGGLSLPGSTSIGCR